MRIVEKEGNKIDVIFRLTERNPGIMSPPDEVNNVVLQIDECEFEPEKFDNLDVWLLETALFKQYKDHIDKRILKKTQPTGLFVNRDSPFFQAANRP